MDLFRQITTRTIYILSLFTGIVAGFVALAFHHSIYFLQNWLTHHVTHVPIHQPGAAKIMLVSFPTDANKILFLILPVAGGLITGLIIHFFGSESRGSGTEVFLDAFHNKAGNLRKRTAFIKFLSSVATISAGGSGGKEGPMTLIGAAVGSYFGAIIKMGARARRTLLLAGAAGGLGAIFRTPLGGAITAVEVLYKEDFESDSLIPCIISSVTAYTVFGSFAGFGHLLKFSAQTFQSPMELVFYVFLALVCTLFASWFVRFFKYCGEHLFAKIPLPRFLVPAFGGLLVGCVSYFVPEVVGGGLGVVQQAIYGTYNHEWTFALQFFLLLAVLKIFTTTFTVQSGGSAGVMAPSLFIGAMLGGAVGTLFNHLYPESVPSVTPYIVVGMAAFFAAVTNASLGALVMVTELTGGYELLPPLMLVAVISLIFSHKWGIYRNQVVNKFYSKAHLWDMNPAILKNTSIDTAFTEFENKAVVSHKLLYVEIKKRARELHVSDFLVKDDEDRLLGILSMHDMEFGDEVEHSGLDHLLLAKDMVHQKIAFVTPEDTLFKVMQFLTQTEFEIVPVVDIRHAKSKLLGYLTRKDVLKFYNSLGST